MQNKTNQTVKVWLLGVALLGTGFVWSIAWYWSLVANRYLETPWLL